MAGARRATAAAYALPAMGGTAAAINTPTDAGTLGPVKAVSASTAATSIAANSEAHSRSILHWATALVLVALVLLWLLGGLVLRNVNL